MDAASEQDALHQLAQQSLTPIKLQSASGVSDENASKAAPTLDFNKKLFARKDVANSEKILIISELATLLRAGITLVDAIDSLALARAGTPAGAGLRRCHRSLNAGNPFLKALAESAIVFPPYVAQLAATGEMTGKLAPALADAARQMDYDAKVMQEMRNSLTYPVILVLAGISAILGIFMFVVPKFANLVRGTRGADVPEISLLVIKVGVFMQTNWLWIFILALAAAGAFALSLRDAAGRTRWLTRLSALPLVGEWLREAEIGRWATTMGALLGNRVPILAALELSADGLRFPKMRERLGFVIRDVRGGATLAESVAKYGLTGATGVNLIRVGEKSGELPQTIATLGALSMDSGRNRMKRFLLLIEPLSILTIGAMIAVVMIAIMMAITGMNPR